MHFRLWQFGLRPYWFAAIPVCGHFGLSPFQLWSILSVAVATCYHYDACFHRYIPWSGRPNRCLWYLKENNTHVLFITVDAKPIGSEIYSRKVHPDSRLITLHFLKNILTFQDKRGYEWLSVHYRDQRHTVFCLGYVPALAYDSCRVSDQGTTLRASDLHNTRTSILNPFNK